MKKLFNLTEIKSQDGVLHFQRWRILETKYFRFYIHKIFESDKDAHLHNHPWHFLSFLIQGSYTEKLSNGKYNTVNRFGINTHKASDYHKVTLIKNPVISLFFAFGKYRLWGYETSEGHIESNEYRERKRKGSLPNG